jgi:hypothetical protein
LTLLQQTLLNLRQLVVLFEGQPEKENQSVSSRSTSMSTNPSNEDLGLMLEHADTILRNLSEIIETRARIGNLAVVPLPKSRSSRHIEYRQRGKVRASIAAHLHCVVVSD